MKNKQLVILIIILAILVLGMGGYILYDKVINVKEGPKSVEKEKGNKSNENELTTEELLDKITGEWGGCDDEYCYGKIIGKNEKGNYYFTPYVMWSESSGSGTITKTEYIEKDVYILTVHYDKFESEEYYSPEQTVEYKIDVSKLSSNILNIGDLKYQLITIDRDEFFHSIKK